MRIRFYSRPDPRFEFEPGDDAEVPDEVVRRWTLMMELLSLMNDEMFEWKREGQRQTDVAAKRKLIELVYEDLPDEIPPLRRTGEAG